MKDLPTHPPDPRYELRWRFRDEFYNRHWVATKVTLHNLHSVLVTMQDSGCGAVRFDETEYDLHDTAQIESLVTRIHHLFDHRDAA